MDNSNFKIDSRKETLFGIMGIITAFLSLIILVLSLYFSAFYDYSPELIGFMEFFSIMLSLVALVFSVLGELKKEAYHLTAHLALALSVGLLIFHSMVISKGF